MGFEDAVLWTAPGAKDIAEAVAPLELDDHVTTLRARPMGLTGSVGLVRRAFDIDGSAARYQAFLDQWDAGPPPAVADDDLACQILLHTDWPQVVRLGSPSAGRTPPRAPAGSAPSRSSACSTARSPGAPPGRRQRCLTGSASEVNPCGQCRGARPDRGGSWGAHSRSRPLKLG
ncbi:hypothetical protein [Streptomyces sp. NPDC054804]